MMMTMMNFSTMTRMSSKHVISQSQNDRILRLIKQFAETYTEEQIIKTEVEVEYDSKKNIYILYPLFYVKKRQRFPHDIHKHVLAQYVEDMMGVSVHTASARVKEYSNPSH
jgi:hypothetical protein